MLEKRLESLKKHIESLCQKAGRDSNEVKILLASKTIEPSILRKAYELGFSYFGENRVDEFLKKKKELSDCNIQWDFIGHLQSNKAKDVVGQVNIIHSLDRPSLIKALEKRCSNDFKQKVLIEVNTSKEASKAGVSEEDFSALLQRLMESPSLDFQGLMTIATNTPEEKEVRSCFQTLYRLRKESAKISGINENDLELSMGMSNDYAWAIEEGATIIRIGSLAFGERKN